MAPPPPPPPPPPLGVATIEVTGAAAVAAGGDVQLTATAKNAAGAPMSGVPFTWQSSATTVATVSNAGLLHGVAAGAVTVTARADGKSGTLPVVVRDTTTLPATLTGKIERVDLTIAASQTYQVTGNAALVVDSTFIMDGTLVIAPGASLTLYGGKLLRITGALQGDSAAMYALGGGRIEIVGDTPPPSSLRAGESPAAVLGALVTVGSIRLSAQTVVIGPNAFVKSGDGDPGTKADRAGKKAASIEIGTATARESVASNTGKPEVPTLSIVIDRSTVVAGKGGRGYDVTLRTDGAVLGSEEVWTAVAGSGGPGGDVWLQAADLKLLGAIVGPGAGGTGGGILLTGSAASRIQDGSRPNGGGEYADVTAGVGGNGGYLSVSALSVSPATELRQGARGAPGNVKLFGGNGRNGGPGSRTEVTIGVEGQIGDVAVPGGTPVISPIQILPTRIDVVEALNGGNATSPSQPGGPGGALGVTVIAGGNPGSQPLVIPEDAGNGGLGYDGCAVTPTTDGSKGGDGGELRVVPFPIVGGVGRVFSGGHGGPGRAVRGLGGLRGNATFATFPREPYGDPGNDGVLCPPGSVAFTAVYVNVDGGLGADRFIDGIWVDGPRLNDPTIARLASIVNVSPANSAGTTHFVVGSIGSVSGNIPPGLAHVTLDGNELSLHQGIPRQDAQFSLALANNCVLSTESTRGVVASYTNPATAPFQFIGDIPVPGALKVLPIEGVSGVDAVVQTSGGIVALDVNSTTCQVVRVFEEDALANLRATGIRGDKIYAVSSPLIGASTLNAFTVTATGIQGPTATLTLPNGTFDVATDPSFPFIYAVSSPSNINAISIGSNGVLQIIGQFSRRGADRLDISFTPAPGSTSYLVWNNVSNFNEGGICAESLALNGLPTGNVTCTTSPEWIRPHTAFTTFGGEGLSQAPALLRIRGRRAP